MSAFPTFPITAPTPMRAMLFIMVCLPGCLLASRTLADLSVTGLGLWFLWQRMHRADWQWLRAPWCLTAVGFAAYAGFISLIFSLHPMQSVLYSLFFLRWPLYALAMAYWLQTPSLRNYFMLSSLIVTSSLMLDCVWQFWHGVDIFGHPILGQHRLTGPYSAPLPGIHLVRMVFICNLGCILLQRAFKIRLFMQACYFLIVLAVLMLTGERMALWLFIGGAACIMASLAWGEAQLRRPLFWTTVGMTLLMAVLATMMPSLGARAIGSVWDKISHFSQSDYGLVFRAAIAVWQQAPWFGHGMHTYREVCDSMGVLARWGMQCTHPHQLYLLVAAETGLIGLALYCLMLILMFRAILLPLYQTKQWWLMGNVTAILFVSFFPLIGGISLWNNWVAALTWTGVGVALAFSQHYGLAGQRCRQG